MNASIVHSSEPIVLVGGGNAAKTELLDTLALASGCVAADGGARLALDHGIDVAAVIGDFDSLSDGDRARVQADRLHHIAEQDSTDFDKALRQISAPVVLAVGFTGARLDHQLAALNVLTRYPERPCVLVSADELTVLCPPHLHLPTLAGEVVSLFPMGPVAGRSTGLRWPIDGLVFDPSGQVGTSNQTTGALSLEMEAPHMLVMLPRRLLAPLTQVLASAPPSARWPAPAARYTAPQQS